MDNPRSAVNRMVAYKGKNITFNHINKIERDGIIVKNPGKDIDRKLKHHAEQKSRCYLTVDENKRRAVNLISKILQKTKRISFTFSYVSCLFIYLLLSLHTNLRLWPIIKQQKKKLKLS